MMRGLSNSGLFGIDELPPKCYDSLKDFSPDVCGEIIRHFADALKRGDIRNKIGFFIGLLKQCRQDGKELPRGSRGWADGCSIVTEGSYSEQQGGDMGGQGGQGGDMGEQEGLGGQEGQGFEPDSIVMDIPNEFNLRNKFMNKGAALVKEIKQKCTFTGVACTTC
jgi:hypothetical protein